MGVAFSFGVAVASEVTVPTAREAVGFANAKFPSGAQNQVLRIEGTHSDSDMRPREWSVTVYDTSRVNNAATIRVKDGVLTSVGTPLRLFEDARWSNFDRNFTGYESGEVINTDRWKLDSPAALSKAMADPALANVQVTEVRMTLRKLSNGDVPALWRVYLRARSRANPGRESWVGYVDLSAETGEIVRNELRVGKLIY